MKQVSPLSRVIYCYDRFMRAKQDYRAFVGECERSKRASFQSTHGIPTDMV